jgi:hypothetical protein
LRLEVLDLRAPSGAPKTGYGLDREEAYQSPSGDRLFFIGGANGFRGFKFRDLGPKRANDTLLNSDSPLMNVGITAPDFNVEGVRLMLPIGPVRIDYGVPIQKDSDGRFYWHSLDAPGPGYREQVTPVTRGKSASGA